MDVGPATSLFVPIADDLPRHFAVTAYKALAIESDFTPAVVAARLASTDDDGDGIPFAPTAARCVGGATTRCADNCPHVANPSQADRGGVGAGSSGDGIGDACQCGDVNGDGRVESSDLGLISRSLLTPPTALRTRPELCNVGGSPNPATQDCTIADVVILRRALLDPPTATIQQVCEPARP
jgi:hypothetical protein